MTEPGKSDEQVLAAFIRGEREALGELARRYERPLLGLALGMLGGRRDLAADAIQETWVRVIRFASGFKGDSSVKTWLYRIAINQCRTMRMRHSAVFAASSSSASAPAVAADGAGSDEHRRVIHTAVNRLAAAKRDIVLLCYHAGMTHERAAEILGIPLGTLKSRLHGALEELRATLAPEVSA